MKARDPPEKYGLGGPVIFEFSQKNTRPKFCRSPGQRVGSTGSGNFEHPYGPNQPSSSPHHHGNHLPPPHSPSNSLSSFLSPPLLYSFPTNTLPQISNPLRTTVPNMGSIPKTWVHPSDDNHALNSQTDADLAYDIFRWTSHQRGFTHNSSTYLNMIQISVAGRRHRHAVSLEEALAGACTVSLPLYNSLIRFCCSHRCLFNRAFDVYKKMLKEQNHDCKPNLDTYAMLFNGLLERFNKLNVSYVYLNAVRSLSKQIRLLEWCLINFIGPTHTGLLLEESLTTYKLR